MNYLEFLQNLNGDIMEETIIIWRDNKPITMWKFIYEMMQRCKGG